ncbi:PhnD/SsuA/transferrin family substrate-binding protein [Alicyclobacillus suci]|uniref:PhnD/SsuA/transferrin family substrate-binding protein n=1 Tax=Alicyclobacillus suci TaxID=2816080 RepID=UPI001A8E4476|nr:PhnD/SsuA/transferrin family substrate-binding protein [Alicyclobacillus suci]
MNIHLTMACWDYDQTRALRTGKVRPDGIDLTYLSLPVEEIFFRMLQNDEFEVAEMSLSSYVMSLFDENPRYIAIPVFPLRAFRHSAIFVNSASRIQTPADLVGKRVATPEYEMTAGVWIRGMLFDEYSVPVDSVKYFTGGQEQAGRKEKLQLNLPPNIRVEPIPSTETISSMLDKGEVDAMYTARKPSSFLQKTGRVVRLFPNHREVEQQYYKKTGLFPIMHTVVIRRDVYQKYPWVAQSLTKAFIAAQRDEYDVLYRTAAPTQMVPWFPSLVEDAQLIMGDDFWAYGFHHNKKTLFTFLRYSYEQGLSKRQLDPEELFAKETLESFKI